MRHANHLLRKLEFAAALAAAVLACANLEGQQRRQPAVSPPAAMRTQSGPLRPSSTLIAAAQAHAIRLQAAQNSFGGNDANSALIALLRKQSAAARSLLLSSSTREIGAGGRLSSNGNVSAGMPSGSTTVPSHGSNGQTNVTPLPGANGAAAHTAICSLGIAAVDGQASHLVFSPVPGPEGTFVIQGCGFGNTPGSVYLTGVHYSPPSRAGGLGAQVLGAAARIPFHVAANGWTDKQIVASIDSTVSGFSDTFSPTLSLDPNNSLHYFVANVAIVVVTAGGQQYERTGYDFMAAREVQTLTAIPPSQFGAAAHLAAVNDSTGSPVVPQTQSPSTSVLPGHTFAVIRNRMGTTAVFPGGTDTYYFDLAKGFEFAPQGVQMYAGNANASDCNQANGSFSENGSWSIQTVSGNSLKVSWKEQACLTISTGTDLTNYGSASVYALDIKVVGPRGVSPWP